MVMAHEMVSPPTDPVLLHWLSPTSAALATLPSSAVSTGPSENIAASATITPIAVKGDLPRRRGIRVVIRSASQT
jgi:hypothetical protein